MDRAIIPIPGRDGRVYEMRKEEAGTFITPSGQCRALSEVKAGFTPALPLEAERREVANPNKLRIGASARISVDLPSRNSGSFRAVSAALTASGM